jgi:hypothetical protein
MLVSSMITPSPTLKNRVYRTFINYFINDPLFLAMLGDYRAGTREFAVREKTWVVLDVWFYFQRVKDQEYLRLGAHVDSDC